MDFATLINPMIVSGAAGVVLAGALLTSLIAFRNSIVTAIKTVTSSAGAWIKNTVLTWKTFFWVVNIICMVFSAQNAGYFFGLYEPVGIALAFVLDLMIIVFMQTMLSAKAQGDAKRSKQIIWFIALCALLSTVGNLVHNLQVQDSISGKINHVWFNVSLPYIGSCVPLLLILLALVADIATKANLDKMNVEEYEAEMEKKALVLEARNRYLARHLTAERTYKALNNKLPGSFRWPWEQRITAEEILELFQQKNTDETPDETPDVKELNDQFLALKKQAEENHLHQQEQLQKQQEKHAQTLQSLVDKIGNLQALLGNENMVPETPPLDVENLLTEEETQDANTEELELNFPTETEPEMLVVTDENRLELTVGFLAENRAITDEELAQKLGMDRPAAARFWRIKAEEILKKNSEASGRQQSVASQQKNNTKNRLTAAKAANMDCCRTKHISAQEIRSAISEGKVKTFTDGSIVKTSLENWAKTVVRAEAEQLQNVS